MNSSLEKIFFNWIIINPKFYTVVDFSFFKNETFKFVYKIIQEYMISTNSNTTPKARQLFEMVSIVDERGMITKEIFKSMLQIDMNDYDAEHFIIPKFKAWIIGNRIKMGTSNIIDITREMDNQNDLSDIIDSASKIKTIIDDATNDTLIKDDEDLGTDFDDAEEHIQDSSILKVKTGYKSLDHLMGGGWDVATLNVIMGMTNAGKCVVGDTKIKIKNKVSGEEKEISIEELFKSYFL
jgi:hypothetical protein